MPGIERLTLIGLVLAAVGLRLIGIGHLSFAGDEETTTLAAKALLEGWPPTLPGGLVYVRGLPFTALEALSISLFGVSEAALRVIPALCAGPRIFAAWWLARPFTGARLALVVAGLLALAPLDFEQSRNARMYSMFATFDLLAVAATVHIALGRRRAVVAILCGVTAVATHIVAITHGVVPFVAALGRGMNARRRTVLVGVGVALVGAFLIFKRLSKWAYSQGQTVEGAVGTKTGPVGEHIEALAALVAPPLGTAAVGIGLLASAILAVFALRSLEGPLTKLAGATCVAAAAIASPVLALVSLAGTFALAQIPPEHAHRRAPWLIGSVVLATTGYCVAALGLHGISTSGLTEVAKFLLSFPAPNWFELAASAPALFLLALVGTWVATERGARARVPGVWLALIIAAFGPALISGIIDRKAGLRFEIHAVAPLLILAVLGAQNLVARLRLPSAATVVASAVLVGCAMRPDYTLQAIVREHGPVDSPFAANVAPDHHGAADFVRVHAADDEWIVAEDPLQQFLLIGRTELWLRSFEDAKGFLRVDREGVPREVYTGSRLVGDIGELRALANEAGQHVVWLVTSGECEASPEWYRTPETDELLRGWHALAWYEGADGMTRVYRLVDGEPVPPRRFGKRR